MMRQSAILLFVVLVELFACKGKQNRLPSASTSSIVEDIAKTNVLMGSAVGIDGGRPKQWDTYEALRSMATDKELLSLTDDTNGVVRCYAFQALAERKAIDLFPVLLQHLSDTATVQTMYGCLAGYMKVGDFFLETITERNGDYRVFQFNDKQKETIDSLLLFGKGNKLNARDKVLTDIEPNEKYYTRIRQIAIEENHKVAVVALSKYRKQQDRFLIAQLLEEPKSQSYGFASVRNFPDPFFFPALGQALKREIKKDNGGNDERLALLYQAIIQYKDQPSRALLQSVMKEAKGMQSIYHSDYLHQALKLYPAEIYNGLLKSIHLSSSTRESGI